MHRAHAVMLLLAALAPCCAEWGDVAATAWVHGERNCLSEDYRKVSQTIRLQPGLNTLAIENGRGIIYGARDTYHRRRPVNVILKFDPNRVSSRNTADKYTPMSQAALFQPDGHMTNSQITVIAKATTTVHAFVIDRVRADNAGGVVVAAYRNEGDYMSVSPDAKPFARVWVDAKANCLACDLRPIGKAVVLEPGEYHYTSEGAIAYGTSKLDKERASAQALLDLDPACVDWCDVGCGGPEEFCAPVAAMYATAPWHERNLTVRKRTTIHVYVMDTTPAGNSGAVKVVFRKGHTGI
ncbi:MAG: hypothetical protein HPY44_07180 [Armatimonadetes bacterium]|nr:hypothetical protein [Armatimonadota bacterium]